MPTFRVTLTRTQEFYTEIEAEDAEAAENAAFDLSGEASSCAQCGGWGREWSVDEGDWDFGSVEEVE